MTEWQKFSVSLRTFFGVKDRKSTQTAYAKLDIVGLMNPSGLNHWVEGLQGSNDPTRFSLFLSHPLSSAFFPHMPLSFLAVGSLRASGDNGARNLQLMWSSRLEKEFPPLA